VKDWLLLQVAIQVFFLAICLSLIATLAPLRDRMIGASQ
jgi:hypothetical protein